MAESTKSSKLSIAKPRSFLGGYIKEGIVEIPHSRLKVLVDRYGYTEVLNEIVRNIQEGRISYPLKQNFMFPPITLLQNQTHAKFEEYPYINTMLRHSPFLKDEVRKYKGREIALLFYKQDYANLDIISDYFTEHVRIGCRVDGYASPKIAFTKFAPKIAKTAMDSVLHNQNFNLNTRALSDAIYNAGIKMCTTFKISVAMAIFNGFRPQTVYCYSEGWGDKCIAASLSDTVKTYVGTDPNLDLQGAYENIKIYMERYTNCKLYLYDRAAEDIDLTAIFGKPGTSGNPDLVFTSPPFFTYEIYSRDRSQSSRYTNYQDWLNKWFFPVTLKAWNYIKVDGHLVYHLGYMKETPIVQPIIDYMQTIPNAIFLGQIPLINAEEPTRRPIFIYVWKKLAHVDFVLPEPEPERKIIDLKYQFTTPIYSYPDLNVLAEVQRFVLMRKLTNEIARSISSKYRKPPSRIVEGVSRHLSEIVMNCWGDFGWKIRGQREVIIEEPFFIIPTDEDINLFYSDLTYRINKNQKEGDERVDFNVDEFGIKKFFVGAIEKMKEWKEIKISTDTIMVSVDPASDSTIFHLNHLDQYFSPEELSYIETLLPGEIKILNSELKLLEDRATVDNWQEYVVAGLIRYATLNSGAHQFVLDLNYKEQMRRKFGVNFEAFGSMFNRYYDHFCSLFPDLESPFGSAGNFFALKMEEGIFQANPPYAEVTLQRMYSKVQEMLLEPKPIIYTLSIPQRDDYPLKARIVEDKLFVAHIEKTERFHVALNRERTVDIPSYDHYIFVNDAAKQAIPKDALDTFIRDATTFRQN